MASPLRSVGILAFGLLLGACADAETPLELQASAAPAAHLEGSYSMGSRLSVRGGEVYVLSVHFGRDARADGRTYLSELGVTRGGNATHTMHQQQYTQRGDTLFFGSGAVDRGVLSADGRALYARLLLDGESLPVTLLRH